MSGDDLKLNVPLDAFSDFVHCSVCLSLMDKCHITTCGHRFCEKCIKEWVGRHHRCPCCNGHLDCSQLIPDLQFDALIYKLQEEKAKSEKKYFDDLINSTAHDLQADSGSNLTRHFSPVELVLKDHIKTSLAAHEKYYQDLKEEFTLKKRQIELELEKKIDLLGFQTISQEELDAEKLCLKQSADEQTDRLSSDLVSCGQLVADAYDKYLTEHIPSLQVLPVTVSMCVLSKKLTIPRVVLKPQDSLLEISEMVRGHFNQIEDSVVKMAENLSFVCFGPLAHPSPDEMNEQVHSVLEEHAAIPHVTVLPPGCRPVLQFQIKPGSTIAVYGQIECESDQPKQCMVTTFNKENPTPTDYFTCKTCGFNWVCRSCMSVCHNTHEVVPYILNHLPNWPCCYCVKKKKCTLVT